ncbi:hypothetical protein [Merismopedia glauca]|uniref:Collagen-like protein n=1 Tax=Merismopedia glauca CCAP 1448/3 TaxID=1296344 RepID=A0A2T1BYB8_9CYAN|nr:hypothetical protein [Merismopedia glauca]PSB01026.1 hypothetical protein C7B64_20475 [Merismopedia glauca CCAP 1448/3]
MKAVWHGLKIVAIATIFNSLATSPIFASTEIFGQSGTDGINGRPGRNGISAPEKIIQATGQPQTVELLGTDGENGESGTSGDSASQCQQPRLRANNVCGAKGGSGGDGGDGGKGGNGGSTTIYFDKLPQLKNITLRNRGGRGGVGGQAGNAGYGCNCTRGDWIISYCDWVLMSQALNVANAPWTGVQRHRFLCSGDSFYDERNNRPEVPQGNQNYRYGWKYLGLSDRRRYTCDNGQSGSQGRQGQDGQTGSYGQVSLVRGDNIPQEQVSYSDRPSALSGKTISLLKNNWLEKTGLSSLLSFGSDVPNSYRILQTVRGNFKVLWQTKKTFAELGDPEIKGTIVSSGDLDLDIPGTLEYKVTGSSQQRLLTVSGGIDPKRLARLKFEGFNRFVDPRNFTLLDEANLISELKGVRLTVTVSHPDLGSQTVSYAVTPQSLKTEGLSVQGRFYQVSLGNNFERLVPPGQRVKYHIELNQITCAGVTYTSGMRFDYKVGMVDFNPQVEYY